MFFGLPKRVKDLPRLESDSEDELKTPAKFKLFKDRDKENSNEYEGFRNPRRVSELPRLESDSDDENKNDRLNCAILDDSFILSPSKTIEGMELTPQVQKCIKENNMNHLNDLKMLSDDSFSSNLKKLNINEKDTQQISPKCKAQQSLFKPILSSSTTTDKTSQRAPFSLFHQYKHEESKKLFTNVPSSNLSVPSWNTKSVSKVHSYSQIETSSVSTATVVKRTKSEELPRDTSYQNTKKSPIELNKLEELSKDLIETPFKTAEANFVTPQVNSFQIPASRRHRLLSSNTSRKTLKDEFRSPKILFQTPISVSRAPIMTMANDSITLSLDDTVKDDKNKKTEKLSPINELKNLKRSSNELFSSTKKSDKDSSSKENIIINGREYILKQKLGCGGSSSVFLAQRKDIQKECALKIVNLRGDRSVVEGYLNETKQLAKLQGNVNVVSLYEYEHDVKNSLLYMVMEKGDSDLHKILQAYKTDLPLYTLVSFWYQMLQAVSYIHENGVIHSDLKPANFLMINGRLKLIDFGIASNISIDSTSIIKFSQAGTFNYISPEALIDTSTGNSPMGKNQPKIKISTKSDVWSLGCILYLLLYKKTPFGHIKNIYHKVNAISNPKTEIEYPILQNYYPIILIEMAQKCLQHNPKLRLAVSDLLKYPFNMLIPVETDQ